MSAMSVNMISESETPKSMINNSKSFHECIEDDFSTSAESSDNEVIASGDEGSSSTSDVDAALSPRANMAATQKELVTELSRLPAVTLVDLCAFLSALLVATGARPLEPVQKFAALAVWSTSAAKTAEHSASQAMGSPPGLNTLACPPGLFLPLIQAPAPAPACSTQHPRRVARGVVRSRKELQAAAGDAQTLQSALSEAPPCEPMPVPAPPLAPLPPLELREFDQAVYRKELSDVLRDLANGSNVGNSVRRIRAQNVPPEKQAAEFSDILTRAAEEHRGAARRLAFAFAAGLANGTFDHEACLAGLEYFFLEVFEDLATEVPRLRNKIANELSPTLRTVFSIEELSRCVPPDCRSVLC